MVQTGPKSQPGGVKKGFLRAAYQVVRESAVVKREPSAPAERQSRQDTTSFVMSASFISVDYR